MEQESTKRGTLKSRYPKLMSIMLAVTVAFCLGVSQSQAASNQPIQTKSGRMAAILDAAAAIQAKRDSASLLELPSSPTPHYFGPFPNWANSQFTVPNAVVKINGDGTGAEASAVIGANGAITDITVTNPGSGYTSATVGITGAGLFAQANAVVDTSAGSVTAVNVDTQGAGYTAPTVSLDGGTNTATAIAYGGVDAVTIPVNGGGFGYVFPTVDFDMPDGPDGVKAVGLVSYDANGTITGVTVTQPGSGYSVAPNVVFRNGTVYDPASPLPGFTPATATATLAVQTVVMDNFGTGYTTAPSVTFTDATGSGGGASATAVTNSGTIAAITVTNPGNGYITAGIRKFQDGLPLLCQPDPSDPTNCDGAKNKLGQYLPVAVPDTTFTEAVNPTRPGPDADYYIIGLVQHREQMNSSLPPTLLREYVQLASPTVPGAVPLFNENLNPLVPPAPALMSDGNGGFVQAYGVDQPHFLGPVIAAKKDRPVRITFYNLLPKGQGGDLIIPIDSTLMGAGFGPNEPGRCIPQFSEGSWKWINNGTVTDEVRDPICSQSPKDYRCFKDNRATLHFHGGITPWISDGTPHQWITPASEDTPYPEGASVGYVPDMVGITEGFGVPNCSNTTDGCQTFYYTNQQSARLMFYHDHAWGITRLNVLLGEAAGYLITDPTDDKLVLDKVVPPRTAEIPLIIQDRTFVPSAAQLAWQDPNWDSTRWGGEGNFWYHHVYMPAQNPGDTSGMSAFGRWMYGPWFWPPATPPYGPIDNPYYDAACDLNDPSTWPAHGYLTDPFCEPAKIPGTPNISVGMEQFNDTPTVNGTAYPTLTVEPKAYRFRILNAANDRFFNLQWYVGDPDTASGYTNSNGEIIGPTEVAFKPSELAAAQLDPNVFPTPDTTVSPVGPSWIQIGNEGGFLPAPVVVPNTPISWIIDPTVFNVGNVLDHSMLLAPAERVDVIVDFSQYAGKTLILYNDAPAAFPARVASYDYYTGSPDLMPVGAPSILPGYGPNTRTVMQVKVANTASAAPFNLTKLQQAFRHKADGSGVFESGQHPIIVGQAAYNSAYGTSFASVAYCNGQATPVSSVTVTPESMIREGICLVSTP